MRYLAIVLSILLMYGPAAGDDPPAPASEPPAGTDPAPASPSEPPVSPAPAPASPAAPITPVSPASPPSASVRPDFATVKQSLVVVRDGSDNTARQAPGFAISDQGHIVTYAGPLRDQPSYQVSNAEGQIFSADRLVADEETGLMILNLSGSGHGVTALSFAKTALQAAAPLHAVTFNPSGPERFTPARGTVTQILTEEGAQVITHNALFSKESAGTPLLNRCYEAVGVNVLEKQGLFQREVDPTEQSSARSLAAASLSRLLASVGLALPVAETECLSLEEERRQAEQARQQQEAALQQERAEAREKEAALQQEQAAKAAAEQKAAALQREKEAVEREAQEKQAALQQERAVAERLAQEKAAAEREAQEKQAALQQERTAAEQQAKEAGQREQQTLLYASIAGGVLLLGIVATLWSKRRRLRHAEEEKQQLSGNVDRMQSALSEAAARDQLRSSAPDVFLEGKTPPIALKIPGAALADQAGAVVGRSPAASTFVINHEQISRRHFRLSLVAQQVMLEDLSSTNGTSIDGVAVEAGKQTPVRDGNRLALGDLELTLHIGT